MENITGTGDFLGSVLEKDPPSTEGGSNLSDKYSLINMSNYDDYVDYFFYQNDLVSVRKSGMEDLAFWPTVVVYGFAFVIGVTGNSLVVFALLADKKARNVTSSFLVSLAISDLLFLFVCVPYATVKKFTTYWAGGLALCKISGFVEMLSATASILNLSAVSVERYIVIVHPMKSRSWCTMGNTAKIIGGVWVVAVLLSCPLLHIMDTEVIMYFSAEDRLAISTCMDSNTRNNDERIIFAWYQLVVMFLLPTLVMVFCYVVVIHVLWISTKQLAQMTQSDNNSDDETRHHLTHGGGGSNAFAKSAPNGQHRVVFRGPTVRDHSAEVREARKQVIKMLMTIIGVFLVAWGPKLIFNIMKKHELLIFNTAYYFSLVINLLPFIQSAANPIIYGFMSRNFRRSMRTACRWRCHCDPAQCMKRRTHTRPLMEYDLDTKSYNGAMCTSRYSPTMSKTGRSYTTTVLSDC